MSDDYEIDDYEIMKRLTKKDLWDRFNASGKAGKGKCECVEDVVCNGCAVMDVLDYERDRVFNLVAGQTIASQYDSDADEWVIELDDDVKTGNQAILRAIRLAKVCDEIEAEIDD